MATTRLSGCRSSSLGPDDLVNAPTRNAGSTGNFWRGHPVGVRLPDEREHLFCQCRQFGGVLLSLDVVLVESIRDVHTGRVARYTQLTRCVTGYTV
ncbi:hypothetical protein RSPPQCQH_CDS0027 [Mycolicibacterium phage phi1_186001]